LSRILPPIVALDS